MFSSFLAASLRSSSEMVLRMFLTAGILASAWLANDVAFLFLLDEDGIGDGRLPALGLMAKSVIAGCEGVFFSTFLDFGRRLGVGDCFDVPALGLSAVIMLPFCALVDVAAGSNSSFV